MFVYLARRHQPKPTRSRLVAGSAAFAMAAGMLVSAGVLAPAARAADPPPPPPCLGSPTVLHPFTDAVQQPPVAAPDAPNHYTLTAHLGMHQFSSQWPAVPSLGYSTANATVNYLGPTIATKKGTPIDVKLVNALPAADTFGFGAQDNNVVMHRHGGLQTPVNDGIPGQEILPGGSRTNHYPNNQAASLLWYHDHADSVTSYRVYEGLAGFMPMTDNIEPLLNLPSGDFAKAFVLQDKTFNEDGTLCYTHADPEFFGDLPVINGTVAPYQQVAPRRYSFTFINGSDSRFFHLSLKQVFGAASAAPRMTVVEGDSGYVLQPARVNDLLIAPGERYKVVVDFTGRNGQEWALANDAATPYPDGDDSIATIPELMKFVVSQPLTAPDRSSVPSIIPETNNVIPPAISLLTARLRTVTAGEIMPGMPLLGDAVALREFTDPATETPQLGSTEAWAMRNYSPDTHPIHEHLVELRLVGRWPAVFNDDTGQLLSVGKFQPPGAFESGPKDTFVSPKNMITVWVGTYTIGGTSVWHCHILSHEDAFMMEMMRPLVVGNAPQTKLPRVLTMSRLDQLVRQP